METVVNFSYTKAEILAILSEKSIVAMRKSFERKKPGCCVNKKPISSKRNDKINELKMKKNKRKLKQQEKDSE